ncbi:hypothetical protein A0J61_07671 [Choanephora cucurbitarum]|uniref:Uncharacterized protein n=1 Tax=Choanephora cucurbitarum TaxID=101091 RepID=A0A1C7N576_9FUNG|nr:hypothetical protein A0J61_07671 [Choanephora cucurbitarum]
MNCCSKTPTLCHINQKQDCCFENESTQPISGNYSPSTVFADNNSACYQLKSGFCQYCGVDVSFLAHEFWCRFSTTD